MRHVIVAVLLCACAQPALVKRPSPMRVAVEVAIKATEDQVNYYNFYKEFMAGHYNEAKTIADLKKVDHQKISDVVLTGMWQQVANNGVIWKAKEIAQKFQLDSAAQAVFAKSAFAFAVKKNLCAAAFDLAFWFDLGSAYADKAVNCAQLDFNPDSDSLYQLVSIAEMACGQDIVTNELRTKLTAKWIEIFEQKNVDYRDYYWMVNIANICPFTAEQYADLFDVGIVAGQLNFSLAILQAPGYKALGFDVQPLYRRLYKKVFEEPPAMGLLNLLYNWPLVEDDSVMPPLSKSEKLEVADNMLADEGFQKTPADVEKFVATAINQLKCGLAATAAIQYGLPDNAVEKVFLNQKCFGGTLFQLNLGVVPPEKAKWLFALSLQAREYLLARDLVNKFAMGDDNLELIVKMAIAARDVEQVIEFSPPKGMSVQDYKDKILGAVMNLNEEWFVARYAFARKWLVDPHTYTQTSINYMEHNTVWDQWIKRAFEHALKRNAFALAADIANKRQFEEARAYGIQLAFDMALQAKSKEAEEIAGRWPNPERKAWLDARKKKAEAIEQRRQKQREEMRRKIRACQKGDDWCVQQVK